MPSHLRIQSSFQPIEVQATYQTSFKAPAAKKQKMSLTQTYYIASSARSKLGREAGKPDHNLRRLVGHANLLDNLMLELADAEREQEAWFNQSVRKAVKPEEPRHITWADTIEESDEEMDSDDEEDEEDYIVAARSVRQAPVITETETDEHYDDEDDEEHALIRVPSRHSPPELASDDSDSEEESMPSSPESIMLDYSEKEHTTPAAFYNPKSQPNLESFIMQQSTPMIAAF